MQRSIVLLAMMAVIGLGWSVAKADLAELAVDVIGDPGEGGSWWQTFSVSVVGGTVHVGGDTIIVPNGAAFDRLAVSVHEFRAGSGPFESPALRLLPSDWLPLTVDELYLANAASSTPVSSLGFTANFQGTVPTSGSNYMVMMVDIGVFLPGVTDWGLKRTLTLNRRNEDTMLEWNTVVPVNESDSLWAGEIPEIRTIPAPAAIGLGLIGLALVGWLKRRVA